MPRTTREVGAWITREYGIDAQNRSGLIALLHRLGVEHSKPTAISRKLNPAKQAAFIKSYDDLPNQMLDDETVILPMPRTPATAFARSVAGRRGNRLSRSNKAVAGTA